ncbi:Indoleamine 2,3-dioxygenase [Atractiella rhizophila]|nr:Indoleamine 2,3-dioxygenase [Atractiella rhizophila]
MPSLPRTATEVEDAVVTGRPDTTTLAAADFDIDVRTGFLPPSPPVEDLRMIPEVSGSKWRTWEELLERGRKECWLPPGSGPMAESEMGVRWEEKAKMGTNWKRDVEGVTMEESDMEAVRTDVRLMRRAYIVLAFVQHFYVHSIDEKFGTSNTKAGEPELVVPISLGRPFWEVSGRLGLPPVLTYAATVLWNWKFKDPSQGYVYDNFDIVTTFTPSPSSPEKVSSEAAFYLTSLHVELHSSALLSHLRLILQESFLSDSLSSSRLISSLNAIKALIDQLTMRMKEDVNAVEPGEFYWHIRRWFNGGRWRFQQLGEGSEDLVVEMGGPSAGQSTLIHALDLILGIDHRPRDASHSSGDDAVKLPHQAISGAAKMERRESFSSSASEGEEEERIMRRMRERKGMSLHDKTFMARMALYMPWHHRQFLIHLSNPVAGQKTLREMALEDLSLFSSGGVRNSYNEAVTAMKGFRDEHIRIVARFIVAQARRGRQETEPKEKEKKDEVVVTVGKGKEKEKLKMKGTGGTDLIRFLKACRERTVEGIIREPVSEEE